MSQNSDDYRNNPRNYPPPDRANSNQPNSEQDYTVPSLIFDEYGELKPNGANWPQGQNTLNNAPTVQLGRLPQPQPQPGPQQPQPGFRQQPPPPQSGPQPAPLPEVQFENQFEANSMPSLLFDEYGELKSSVFKRLKPAAPQEPTLDQVQGPTQGQYPLPPQPQPFYQGQGPVQGQYPAQPGQPPQGWSGNGPQGAPRFYQQGHPPQPPYYQAGGQPQTNHLGGPVPVVRQDQGRLSKWIWIGLGVIAAILILGIVLLLVVIITRPPTPPASTTLVLFDPVLKVLSPGSTPGMVVKSFREILVS